MANKASNNFKKTKRFIFLKDVFIIALSAYGGPNMHLALYQKRLVDMKNYITNEELLELYSLCQMLPGPSSTQTITSIGYKFGGPFLAFLTLLVWILPAFILLTLCALFMGVLWHRLWTWDGRGGLGQVFMCFCVFWRVDVFLSLGE